MSCIFKQLLVVSFQEIIMMACVNKNLGIIVSYSDYCARCFSAEVVHKTELSTGLESCWHVSTNQ